MNLLTMTIALLLTETPAVPPTPQAMGAVTVRGEKLKGLKPVALSELLASPSAHEGKTVALEGRVRQACQKKGCWMEITQGSKEAVRVTFKDYGFFVPKDCAGSRVKLEGVVAVKELSEAKAKHYEDEGATVPRGKDGVAREVSVVASGVELTAL